MYSLSNCMHDEKAFPVVPTGQLHIGVCFITVHCALKAHTPGHGSRHFRLMQALSKGQSEL